MDPITTAALVALVFGAWWYFEGESPDEADTEVETQPTSDKPASPGPGRTPRPSTSGTTTAQRERLGAPPGKPERENITINGQTAIIRWGDRWRWEGRGPRIPPGYLPGRGRIDSIDSQIAERYLGAEVFAWSEGTRIPYERPGLPDRLATHEWHSVQARTGKTGRFKSVSVFVSKEA